MNSQLDVKGKMNVNNRKNLHTLWGWIKWAATVLICSILIHQFVFQLSIVQGSSMNPTLEHNQRLFINKFMYQFADPKQGDVIVFKHPLDDVKEKYLVKRVVAEPGDIVEIKKGRLIVNGVALEEPYTATNIQSMDQKQTEVASDHYFVMGDNRYAGGSTDSRIFGTIHEDLIVGRADWIVWPWSQIGGL
ncbi:signal peptidase I [Longirhabdus pacifica]|uniref:signal peptidase I n=1 Tax=Longirhabdus pacifica TaxID=2305227 RepID=UPI0010088509|nr:signal peptidase I [Longirhabdus pacifica]